MFFIINTSIVNAKMYKILDSEGNVIRLTNNPTLSIKEKEAGYTISPPPAESTEPIQDQIINGQEIKQEVSSGNEKYDFRKTKWGMSKEQVKEIEKSSILLEEDVMNDSMRGCDGILHYKGEINGLDCGVYYYFMKNRLVSAAYKKRRSIKLKDEYIDNYKNLKTYLVKKYGGPNGKAIEILEDEPLSPFALVFWDKPIANVVLMGLNLMEYKDKNEIGLSINYQSEEGKELNKNLAIENEKEKSKKELESRIKELENQPKSEIKFVDSTNRLCGSGNYYYVEGILKNIGKGYSYHLRVKVQSLDKYGKLVSIDECYADPSTPAPDKEATYQAMVNYNSKIDKFSKTVYWSNTY